MGRNGHRAIVAITGALALTAAATLPVLAQPVVITDFAPSLVAPDPARPGLNYFGSVRLDPQQSRLDASWTVIVEDDTLRRLTFRLNPDFGPMRITGPGVAAAAISDRTDTAIRYDVDLVPTMSGADRVIRMNYSGQLNTLNRAFSSNRLDADGVELSVDSLWFPFDARFDTPLTARLFVVVDGDWTAVGNGATRPVRSGFILDQTARARASADANKGASGGASSELRPFDIVFALHKNAAEPLSDDFVLHDARPQPGANRTALIQSLQECRAFLSDLAGPLPRTSVLIADRPDGAYARASLMVLGDIEFETPTSLQHMVCHELAHHWSGANTSGGDNWLNEAVADYAALMELRAREGKAAFEAKIERYESDSEARVFTPVWMPSHLTKPIVATPQTDINLYRRGPLALHALEARMGRTAFQAFLVSMMKGRVRTTKEWLHHLELQAGADVRRSFESALKR